MAVIGARVKVAGRWPIRARPIRDRCSAKFPLSTAAEAESAIQAAYDAFPAWRDTPAPVRAKSLWRLLELLEANKHELGAICALEEGKTFGESVGEVMKSANAVEYFAGEGRRLGGETLPSEMPKTFCYTSRHPLGVVSVITPWNFPYAIPCWKIAPAVVAGNTVVWKPATLTPWTAYRLTELMEEAGFPPGVVNLIYGSGGEVGNTLVTDDRIGGITFTGSNEVGAGVYAEGAKRLRKVQCEMGGKNPLIVLADADVTLAATATAQGAFGSTGQRCTATSRAIVVDAVADEFVKKVTHLASDLHVGNPLVDGVQMGPSVDKSQFQTVLDYIKVGEKEGAQHQIGGRRLESGEWEHGFFSTPCVFDHVEPNHRIAQEEIFGPVLSVIRVKDFEHAMEGGEQRQVRALVVDLHERHESRISFQRSHRDRHRAHQLANGRR